MKHGVLHKILRFLKWFWHTVICMLCTTQKEDESVDHENDKYNNKEE